MTEQKQNIAIGFTGSRGWRPEMADLAWLGTTLHAAEYVTGADEAFDAWVGQLMATAQPNAKHTIVVPSMRSRVDYWWRQPAFVHIRFNVINMSPRSTFEARNHRLVEHCDRLIGLPAWTEGSHRSTRSGTWQTIRFALRSGRFNSDDVAVMTLNEGPPIEDRVAALYQQVTRWRPERLPQPGWAAGDPVHPDQEITFVLTLNPTE